MDSENELLSGSSTPKKKELDAMNLQKKKKKSTSQII